MHEIRSQIDIRTPAERVWSILTDFSAYASWNPFITRAEGLAEAGRQLRLTIKPVGGRAISFRPTVIAAVSHRELRWRGQLFVPGLFDGEHSFSIEATGSGSLLVQSERFSGLLVPFLRRSLDRGTRLGFEAMNAALKRRAERDE